MTKRYLQAQIDELKEMLITMIKFPNNELTRTQADVCILKTKVMCLESEIEKLKEKTK